MVHSTHVRVSKKGVANTSLILEHRFRGRKQSANLPFSKPIFPSSIMTIGPTSASPHKSHLMIIGPISTSPHNSYLMIIGLISTMISGINIFPQFPPHDHWMVCDRINAWFCTIMRITLAAQSLVESYLILLQYSHNIRKAWYYWFDISLFRPSLSLLSPSSFGKA